MPDDPIKKFNGVDKGFIFRKESVKFTKGSKRLNAIVDRIKKHNEKLKQKAK